jgi:hypothetical protein
VAGSAPSTEAYRGFHAELIARTVTMAGVIAVLDLLLTAYLIALVTVVLN